MLQKFLEEIVVQVEKEIGISHRVMTECVLKNNGVEQYSILIMKEGEHISPSIYLNQYYEQYQSGKNVETIAKEILENYYRCKEKKNIFLTEFDLSFPNFKEKIFYRLVNYKENQKMLETAPYVPFLDLAITFYCLVEKSEETIGTLHITNDLLKEWKVEKEELFKLAMKNTPILFPVEISTIDEIVGDLLKKDIENLISYYEYSGLEGTTLEEAKEYFGIVLENLRKNREVPIYVMTNTSGINGAATLLYENVLEQFSCQCQSDFYILPSSIHEILLIPYNEKFEKKELKNMVNEVNQTQVPKEDILSDEVYLYCREGNYLEWKEEKIKREMIEDY